MNTRLTAFAFALVMTTGCSTTQQPSEPLQPLPQPVAQKPVAPPVSLETEVREEYAAPAAAGAVAQSLMAHDRASVQRSAKMMVAPSMMPVPCCYPAPPVEESRENYGKVDANPVQQVAVNPVSTFSIDVDTGSYSNVRRFLKRGQLPPADAVRVEELVNYFDYDYAPPRDRSTPFSVSTEMAVTPWNKKTRLLHVGIQGWKPQAASKPSNLVFLLDVSGSMNDENKLPLVKSSLKLLTKQMSKDDRISLVVYAGSSGVVLEPTPGNQTAKIVAALDKLQAGGSTNGGEGIQAAYAMAEQAFMKDGNNRVLLATDGDFNVGTTTFDALLDLIKEKRKSGIALTTLGFGEGNYNDHLMEQLADAGNGNYAYIDTLSEAQKVLVDQREATLTTIARDVKIQIEFNPALVSEYRLIGYENRLLKREDFNNDKVDAGEIGAGHTVTALYEVALTGSGGTRMDPLRYGKETPVKASGDELAFLRLRYKKPQDGMDAASILIERPIHQRDIQTTLANTSNSYRLAASVAGFGQLLRGGQYTESFRYTDIEQLAQAARGEDRHGYAGEFLQLVKLANSLSTTQVSNRSD